MGRRVSGKQVARLSLVLTALVAALLAVSPAAADGPQSGAPWPLLKRDGTRSANTTVNGPYQPAVAWTQGAGSAIVGGPAIAADGTIYIGTDGGTIIAVRADGTRKWVYQVEPESRPTHLAINRSGYVVFGTESGLVIAVKADGAEAWRFDLDGAPYSEGRVAVRGHPMLSANYSWLLIGADNGVLYELDEDGVYHGVRRAVGAIRAGAAFTPDGTLIWVDTTERALYGGFASGGDKFRVQLDGDAQTTPAIAADNTTYVGTNAGSLYAIRSDGTQKWKVTLGEGRPVKGSPALGADGTIYAGSDDGKLYAIDPAGGTTKWTYQTGAPITSAPAVGGNGLIYAGSNDRNLYVLTRDGKLQSTFKTERAIEHSAPALGADGTLYVGSQDGKLYALKEGGPTPTPVPAVTATPVPTATPTPTPKPTDRADPLPGALYFFETGHNVRGAFLDFFNRFGGLEQFGYPRTEELLEDGRTVQYFQRARFEYFPQYTGTPYEVQLQLLGDVVTAARRPFPTSAPLEDTETQRHFPETQHTVRGIFLRYFDTHGGLWRFGYPISEELQEQNNDGTGRTYTVQYFQRARLEYHPELAGTPYEVQLGLLGDQVLRERGWLP
ncbi:MAG: PQQ-binding-like beta-propeller repeat protein [Chloroflexi bacterium]|nr:PQQ-binding-like beta-propeller repeat protein [Chloroflexota bacterium]